MHQQPLPADAPPRLPPTTELIERALRETGELVRAEAALATAELRTEASAVIVATGTAAVAIVLFALAVMLVVAAIFLAFGASAVALLIGTGAALTALGGVAAIVALRLMPKAVLGRARNRVNAEIREIGEHAS